MRSRKSQARQRLCDNRGLLILHATNLTVSRSRHGHREETWRFFTDPASIPPELSISLLNTPHLFNATFSHGPPLCNHGISGQVNRTIVLATADRYVEATHENTPDPIARTRAADSGQPITFVTTPEPTVLPPSRTAKRSPCVRAIGLCS